MPDTKDLIRRNRQWAERIQADQPEFFSRLAKQQTPDYLWIGCSDSRVPANQIVDMLPGELFVHRNVANVVMHADMNCLSVLQFAVEVLQVSHIVVCGHYGCGGVKAALGNQSHGMIDNWLRPIKDIYLNNEERFQAIASEEERLNLLCELNVKQQASNLCHTNIVQNAWRRGQSLAVHGFIYDIADGKLRDLEVDINSPQQLASIYRLDPDG